MPTSSSQLPPCPTRSTSLQSTYPTPPSHSTPILTPLDSTQPNKIELLHTSLTTLLKGSTGPRAPSESSYRLYQLSGIGPPWQKRPPRPENIDAREYMLQQGSTLLTAVKTFFETSGLVDPTVDFYFDMTHDILAESLRPEYISLPPEELLLEPLVVVAIFRGEDREKWPFARLDQDFRSRSLTMAVEGFNDRRLGGCLLPISFKGVWKRPENGLARADSSAYTKMVYEFKARRDRDYPEFRRRLLMVLLVEVVALVERWEEGRRGVNREVRRCVEGKRWGDAERVVRGFVKGCCFESGEWRVLLKRVSLLVLSRVVC
ncbi:hypothetical protein BJ508DRAFT_168494 [Ascobolus immersus RN42]|uniref:Uncharacterized protein n=1 Tax=Ascobolus immersus RN42 TaxID=1160509 RepID=A0A3N4INR7_ASCIM|nr:hypothetical protein BJ508DRAFT_168494 [Ascobolus immersus RN42]